MAQHTKVIFLDVDGVLNSFRNVVADGGFPFPNVGISSNKDVISPSLEHEETLRRHAEANLDRLAIGMVRKLCEEFDAVIVLSSTWRVHVNPVEFGNRHKLPIVAGTDGSVSKAASIRRYIALHPEIESYIVIDDDDMKVGDRQVLTDILEGLTYANYEACVRKLGSPVAT